MGVLLLRNGKRHCDVAVPADEAVTRIGAAGAALGFGGEYEILTIARFKCPTLLGVVGMKKPQGQ